MAKETQNQPPENTSKTEEQTLDARVQFLEDLVANQAAEIEQLKKDALPNKATPVTPKPVKVELPEKPFQVKGKKYKWQMAKFNIRIENSRKTYTAEQAQEDKKVLEYIVEHHLGTLVKEVK